MTTDEASPVGNPHETALLMAVKNLTNVVEALQTTIESDYPTRAEVRRRRRGLILTLISAVVGSYFFTIGTVSYCFLSGIPEEGTHQFCSIFPGYQESFDNNRDFRDRFLELERFIQENGERIEQLEQEGTATP